MADFVVRVEGIEAGTDQADKINREVQAAVLRVLAGTDFSRKVAVRLPRHPEWLGIWIRSKDFLVDDFRIKPTVKF